MRRMNGFLTMDRVKRLLEVVSELQCWIETQYEGRPSAPVVTVSMSAFSSFIEITSCCVWNSECDSEEELSFEACLETYESEVMELVRPFLKENTDVPHSFAGAESQRPPPEVSDN